MNNRLSGRKPVLSLPSFGLTVGQTVTKQDFKLMQNQCISEIVHHHSRNSAFDLVNAAYQYARDCVAHHNRIRNSQKTTISSFGSREKAHEPKDIILSPTEFVKMLQADLSKEENQIVFGLGNLAEALRPNNQGLRVNNHVLYLNEYPNQVSALILSINFTDPVLTTSDFHFKIESPAGGNNVVSLQQFTAK